MTDEQTLDVLFRKTRTPPAWQDKPVSDAQLRQIYDLTKWGPTTANSSPSRFLFLRSEAEKEKLRPALSVVNVKKTMTAPVVAIIAYDMKFFEHLPRLYVANPAAKSWFDTKGTDFIEETTLRNGSMQAAYFLMAARALGLDAAPMSGFENKKVDAAFFPDGQFKSNMLCAVGYADFSTIGPRGPRFDFDEICKIV